MNFHDYQLSDGVIAQLLQQCTSITEAHSGLAFSGLLRATANPNCNDNVTKDNNLSRSFKFQKQ